MLAAIAGIVRFDELKLRENSGLKMLEKMPIPQDFCMSDISHPNASFAIAYPTGSFGEENCIHSDKGLFMASGLIYNDTSGSTVGLSFLHDIWLGTSKTSIEEINGDCMFAGYDTDLNTLQLFVSWGFSSLYYYHCDSFVAFASHPSAFKCFPEIKMYPNLDLMNCVLKSQPLTHGESFWSGITQIGPGTLLKFAKNLLVTKDVGVAKPIQRNPQISDSEAVEQFIGGFKNSIRRRLDFDNINGSTLSAGLDSTAITAVVSELLMPVQTQLLTWTSVPFFVEEAFAPKGCLTDETDLAILVAQSLPNVSHEIVESKDSDVVNAIRKIVYITGKPQYSPANFYWIEDILTRARESNCKRLFIGQCGNGTISWTPPHPRLFPKKLFFPKTPLKKFLRLIKFRLLYKVKSFSNMKNDKSASQRDLIEMHRSIFDLWYHLSLWSGVEVVDPTLDCDLIELLLSLPENVYYQDGMDRRLIRVGLKSILPDKVRLNRKRGQQSSDVVARIKKHPDTAKRALELISTSVLARENLDLNRLNDVLLKIIATSDLSTMDLKTLDDECNLELLRGISAGLYLMQFDTDIDLNQPI